MPSLLRSLLAGLAVAALAMAGHAALAEAVTLKAELKGSHEVPPTKSNGMGSLVVTYDPAERRLSWKGSYSGLTGPVTAAHFHGPAVEGRNAGIALVISAGSLPPSFEGSAIITAAQASDLIAGRWYINLHTAAHPAGEVRGQVLK